MHKRGAILTHQLREARAAIRNFRLRLWDARPEWVDLEAATAHGGLGVVGCPVTAFTAAASSRRSTSLSFPVMKTGADPR